MPDLPGQRRRPVVHPAADAHGRADAGAREDVQHRLLGALPGGPVLGGQRRVRVLVQHRRQPGRGLEPGDQRHAAPARQPGRVHHHAFAHVDPAGARDPDPEHRLARRGPGGCAPALRLERGLHLPQRLRDPVDVGGRVLRRRGQRAVGDGPAQQVHDDQRDLRGIQVHARGQPGRGHDPQHGAGLATRARERPVGLDQALLAQAPRDEGDRLPGEAAGGDDLRLRGALGGVADSVEHDELVALPEVEHRRALHGHLPGRPDSPADPSISRRTPSF